MTRRDGALVSLGLVMLAVCCEPAYPLQNDSGNRRLPGCTWMQNSFIVRTSLVLGLRHRWYGGRGSEDEDSDFVTGGFGPHHDCSNHAGKPCRDSDMLLWRSAFQGEVNATRQALRDGAAVNARNQYDSMRAALHYAVSNRNMSCAHCNQDISDVDPACKCRALIISELLKAGADPLLPCALGARAIHLAAATGAMTAVKVLVQAGVDIGITDHSRRKPLHYAAMEGRVQMSRLLLQLGADVNAADSYGTTPLAAAARRGLSLQVEVLLACGGDGDLYDRLGYSPYSLAIKSKCERTIALLSHLYDRSRSGSYRDGTVGTVGYGDGGGRRGQGDGGGRRGQGGAACTPRQHKSKEISDIEVTNITDRTNVLSIGDTLGDERDSGYLNVPDESDSGDLNVHTQSDTAYLNHSSNSGYCNESDSGSSSCSYWNDVIFADRHHE